MVSGQRVTQTAIKGPAMPKTATELWRMSATELAEAIRSDRFPVRR